MNILKQASLNLRLIKLKRFLGSLFYPIKRDKLERQFDNVKFLKATKPPANIIRAEQTANGGRFYFPEEVELEICFLSDDLVRINWKPGLLPVDYAISNRNWQKVEVDFQSTDDNWLISTNALQIIIASDGSLKFQDAKGLTLREELPPQRKVKANLTNHGWVHQAKLRAEECIYGLGERAAPLNLRTLPHTTDKPRTYRMWNFDAGGIYTSGTDPLYLCIPLYLGLHEEGSYLIFYENTFRANFSFKDFAVADFEDGALRYYFTTGSLPQMMQRYTQLTGCPPLPPRWAFGYHQSRWGYEKEEVLRQVAKGFEQHNLPVSAMHLDIDCMDDFRAFTIDPDRFPKLREFTQEMAAKDIRLITIINPGVKSENNNKLFEEGRAQGVFCKQPNGQPILAPVWGGMCAFPDFTDPQARHWWSRQYEYLLDLGIAGFWHDMNEPGVFTLWGDSTLPAYSTQHSMEGRGGDHREAHNVYGLLQAQAGYEALCEYQPEKRPFIVSRSGWAGLQRYAWTWTGDVETSWAGLQQTIPTLLNLGLSGIPYSGPDIGGFKGNPSAELYLRWFQMACFVPFFRTHSANNVKPRTPWGFGEATLNIVSKYLRLRYQLIPYFYTLAWQATQTGHPPIRPLFWTDSEDSRLWNIEDAFLLGEALLVCPIVREGKRDRTVILPKGRWYDFWNDTSLAGGQEVKIDAPLETIPLLVKAGSILPLEAENKLILHLYPPQETTSESEIYSDAGDGYGDWRLDKFYLQWDEKNLKLTRQQQGNYPFAYEKIQLHLHGFELQQVVVDGKEVDCEENCLEFREFEQVLFKG
ncbi:TIM-barrel domain-containing protein [Calothrix sp. CCY 0018]|uniref:glycoside hydrolase family 31 protein n=1 Tax=Calothrix sp. CCY 0018 TaxID=3103864 RepID=UPI0039C6FDB4